MLPLLLVGTLITEIQRIVIFGFDFTMLRIFLIFGLLRIILRGEYHDLEHSQIDTAVLLFVLLNFCTYMMLHGDLVNRLGFVYSTLGMYFFIRFSMRSTGDVMYALAFFACMCICLAISMAIEQRTGHNYFSIFGGVSPMTEIREGKLRSQGVFPHPLLAGAFGGTLLPLYYWMFRHGRRWIGALGIIASVLMALTAYSSGPILALLAGIGGLLLWPMRFKTRWMRWGVAFGLFGLSFFMKAPVYALVGRFSLFDASGGYHRYALIDQAVKRFGEWWLIGTKSTAHWGWGLWDVTNQYIAVGVEGGVLLLAVFIGIIALCFRNVGRGIRANVPESLSSFFWACGCVLFAHAIAFLGMAYFGM